ncbi:MAG: ATP-binding protein [Geitlerinemataceae cyanobacterium]
MITLPGYQILAQIDESANSSIYRGIREQDLHPVILKVLKSQYPTPLERERFQQEYEIFQRLQNLEVEGVVTVYGLEYTRHTVALVLEDFGGQSLSSLMQDRSVAGGEIALSEFLLWAIEITKIVARIHGAGVIHKDLNLANIGLNPDTGEIKVFDFSISTLLESENLNMENVTELQGTLAYVSPEQTGRTNRSLDYRTDFYSLGVTFYQLLSGHLPFVTTELLEMIHFHLAKQPPSLGSEDKIPPVLSDLVMKMMEKNPEERYQSAWGIHADLVTCLTCLEATGNIDPFILAQNDVSDRFHFPQKLYGRTLEIASIIDTVEFFESARKDRFSLENNKENFAEAILISGNFGIGKSALLREVFHNLIASTHSSCLYLECDPVREKVPYSTMVDILRGLARQLLTENTNRIDLCRQNLLTAIDKDLPALVRVIPELKAIGQVPETTSNIESSQLPEYDRVFPILFRVLANKEYPLVLCLDDWQWIDSASLKIIKDVTISSLALKKESRWDDNTLTRSSLAQNEARPLGKDYFKEAEALDNLSEKVLLIGTSLEKKDCPDRSLWKMLEDLESSGAVLKKIALSPLNTDDISRFLVDILYRDSSSLHVLAKVVARKTGGNPFFIRELLKKLYADAIIYFDRESQSWQWDLPRVESTNITDNLVDLTISNFQKLPLKTQQLLGFAACIGVEFDLNTLSAIVNSLPADVFKKLLPAIRSESIFSILNLDSQDLGFDFRAYKFGHDRIYKLAYNSIEESKKKATHLAIGRFWIHQASEKEWVDRHILKIANQFYLGVDRLSNPEEQQEVAKLQLQAGRKAKASMNLETAFDYLNRGISILSSSPNSTIAKELHQEVSEIASLQSFVEQSDTILNLSIELLIQGKKIEDLKRDIDRYLTLALERDKFNETLSYIQSLREDIARLSGEADRENLAVANPDLLLGYSSLNSATLLAKYQMCKCQIYYFESRIDEAFNMASSVSRSIDYVLSPSLTIAYLFYYSLTLLDLYPVVSEIEQQTFKKQIELNKNQMELWVEQYPEETRHRILLIEAEFDRLSDRFIEAIERYDRAIELARSYQFIHEEALACERAAKFYINWGKQRIAQTYLKEAHYAYTRWGATVKTTDLEQQYPQLLTTSFPNQIGDLYDSSIQNQTTIKSPGTALDLATVMKASRAISQEISLDRFLSKSIEILVENAGAQRGFLIVPSRGIEEKNNQLYIVAQSSVDGETRVLESTPLEWVPADGELPLVSSAIVSYVARTQESIVLDRATQEGNFTADFYIQQSRVKSVLCDPLLYQGQLVGVVYLENNLIDFAFTPDRLQVVRLLSQQATIALENARLYDRLEEYSHTLEDKVEQRTQELQQEICERKLLETRLRSEEGKMRAIFEAMTDIILIIKVRDDGVETLEVSPTSPTRVSEQTQFLVQQTVDRFYEENSDWKVPIQQVLSTQKTQNFDYALRLDDAPIWFTASISPIPGGSVIWVARNITDRVLAEEALRLSEEMFSKSFRASPSAITITRLADGRHVEVNDTFCTLTGYTPEELIGRTALELNLWVNSEDRKNLFQLIQSDGIVRNYEFDFRTKCGQILTALLSVETVKIRGEECLLAISNDITDRKNYEQELQHKNEELARTLEQLKATQDGLVQSEKMASLGQLISGVAHEINTPMGAILASNENSFRALDRTLQDLPKLFQKLSPERLADFLTLLDEAERQSSQRSPMLSFREERKLKRALRNELETLHIPDADTLAATLVSLGITQDIEWLMPILHDRDRDFILETADNLSILKKSSNNIKLAVERASKIVFALKSYSRQGNSGEMTQFLVTEGIDIVLTIYQNQLKQGIETIKNYERVSPIYGFPEELNQVWTNLIHNAIQAMNARGMLEILVCQKDNFVLVQFTDSGCGIPPEIQAKIFDPFFTTKPSGEGSGLGLNIVRKIIERHRGKIEVESRSGRTTFSVWLPVESA